MPTQSIPFSGANRNTDEGLSGNLGWALKNGIVDELGNFGRAFGYTVFKSLGTGSGIDGLHYNEKNDQVLSVSGSKVFKLEEDATTTDITGTGTPETGVLATFADFADDVYLANNSGLIKAPVTSGTTSTITGTYTPTSGIRFLANLNSYLLANDGIEGKVQFADAGLPDTWANDNFFTFEASNDQLQFFGVGGGSDRIYGFGTKSGESWRNDGTTPFVPESQEYMSRGSISRYSPVYIQDTWYFVDEYKNLCRVRGRQAEKLPSQNYLGLTKFLEPLYCEDIEAFWLYANGYNYYVANLPTEQKTFAYNIDLDQWLELTYFEAITGDESQFRGRCAAYATGWQKSLIGDSRSGTIYSVDSSQNTANSDVIRSVLRTGFINRGDEARNKFCSRIYGRVKKKNVNNADGTLKLAVRWRDKLLENAWQQREVNLYKEDDQNYYWYLNGLGHYQRRQWEFICTSDIDFRMTPPVEDFEMAVR